MDQLVYLVLLIVCSVVVLNRFNKRPLKGEPQEPEETSEEK